MKNRLKKSLCAMLVCCLSLSLAACGGNDSEKENETVSVQPTESTSDKSVAETETYEADTTQENSDDQDTPDYYGLYAEILRERGDGYFELIYVDDDDVPELACFTGESAHLQQVSLYTIYQNEAVYLDDLGAYGTLAYSEKNNRIFGYTGVNANEELETKYTYMIEEGALKQAPDHKGYTTSHTSVENAYENNESNIQFMLEGTL